jgi:chromodomain-helicase-DNA-binding protein 4
MLLTHLVVRAGIGQKGPSMTKSELDDVLRWGTEELFKEEDEGKSSEHNIVWDDKAVDALLERGGTTEQAPAAAIAATSDEPPPERKDWANEYLSSFKVATYNTQEEQEEEEEDETEVIKEELQETDPDYWEKLLRHHFEQEQENKGKILGKGKRVRKQVNYASETIQQDWNSPTKQAEDKDYSESYSGDEDDNDGSMSNEDEFDTAKEERERRRKSRPDEKLPPLLARVNGQLEVKFFYL